MRGLLILLLSAGLAVTVPAQQADEALAPLVELLRDSDDPQFQLDLLQGLSEALKGRREVPMPPGWNAVASKLEKSSNPQVRELAKALSVKFGSHVALEEIRARLKDRSQTAEARQQALSTLMSARDPELPSLFLELLEDASIRAGVIRAIAAFELPAAADRLLALYGQLPAAEKRDALNTLVARERSAEALVNAVDQGKVPKRDLTADIVRQLKRHKNPRLEAWIEKAWGQTRESGSEKQALINRYKTLIQSPGPIPNPSRGRAVFARNCQQCHILFDLGGKVGPDLTGSARADLEYILENMVDPNAVIPNEYQSTSIETRDDRQITGIVTRQDPDAVTIVTANEVLTLPRKEIREMGLSEFSMMPEGLLDPLSDEEVRDLIAYLAAPSQVPLQAAPDILGLFFNGRDLSYWDGHPELWGVENGEIVGRSKGLKRNEFLRSQLLLGDFRLVLEVKLVPNRENSGIQFRSQNLPEGEVKGYQADVGQGWWGKLYEEHGRALLWNKPGDAHVRVDDWNLYEIVAVGDRILTAINGKPCVDFTDPPGAKSGIIAFQLHSGGPMEIRFRNLQLEYEPKAELKTLAR